MSYSKAFELWRESASSTKHNIWQAYTEHSFVQQLADGTLPRESYIRYLKQDYLFLIHFSRAWALAVVKSETLEEMKLASATVDALVNIEIRHHVDTCAKFGISEQSLFETTEETENIAYTRYVMDAGLSGDLLDLLAALTPCIMGYGEIGARLSKYATPDNPYTEWIETYADPSYQQVCKDVGSLIDTALEHRLGKEFQKVPRWSRLTDRFIAASSLEASFWEMSLG